MKNNKEKNNKVICPICESEMRSFDYAYDQNQYGKKYYKCDECGHKMNKME